MKRSRDPEDGGKRLDAPAKREPPTATVKTSSGIKETLKLKMPQIKLQNIFSVYVLKLIYR